MCVGRPVPHSGTNAWYLPPTGPTMGPFQVLCERFWSKIECPERGVVVYCSTPHEAPPQGLARPHD